MSANDCLKKTYVKLYYIPPTKPARPVDCKQVKITKSPEIRIFTGQISKLDAMDGNGIPGRGDLIGIDLHCALPHTEGAGGVILLLQVSSYIEWEVEFMTTSNSVTSVVKKPRPAPWSPKPAIPVPEELDYYPVTTPVKTVVRETHRVYVSFPIFYRVPGARIAVMALATWKLKVPFYAGQIWNVYRKLKEMDEVMARISALKKGFCPEDIRGMEEGLKQLETSFNYLLQQEARVPPGGDISWRMPRVDSTGRFAAGTHLA